MARIEKSRKRRIKYTKLSSRVSVNRIQKKSKVRACYHCKKPLHGITNVQNKLQKKLTKSKKRSERRFPELCSSCSRRALISSLRSNEKVTHREDKGSGDNYE